jgi:FHA domain
MRGQGFVLTSEQLTIGRGVENDVRIEDPRVSRRHAVIRWVRDVVTIEDAQSSAGVVVNNGRVTAPRTLRAGDRIRLGPVELELKGGSGPEPAPPRSADAGRPPHGQPVRQPRGAGRQASRVMAGGFACLLAGLVVAFVGYARWVSPILSCISRAQQVSGPATSCIDATGLLIAASGGLLMTVGMVMVIASLVMKRGVRRELARP